MGGSQEMQDGRVKILLDRRAAPQIVTTALFVYTSFFNNSDNVLTTRKLIVWGGGLVN